jgi:hypothetical protein
MNQNMNQNNDEISQDFDNLVGNKGGAADSDNGQMNEQKLLQQRMMQQQAMQQQAMQQQAMQQQAMQQQKQESSDKNTGTVKQEGFMNKFNVKSLSLLGVLFALFYVFSSSQLEGVVTKIPYLSNQQLNLAVRGLLFVVVYFVLDKFVL